MGDLVTPTHGNGTEQRDEFLARLRRELLRAINGHRITLANAWDILREWDAALGTTGDVPGRWSGE